MTDMTPEEAVLESFKADLERGIGKYLIEDEAGLLSAILSLETGLAAASKRIAELIGERPIVCDTCGSADVFVDPDKFLKSAEVIDPDGHWLGNRPGMICPSCVAARMIKAEKGLEVAQTQIAELQANLDMLHGVKFSDRCYHALKSRIEGLGAQVELGYHLSRHAASINWEACQNTEGWLEGLRDSIIAVQEGYKRLKGTTDD